MNKTSKTILKVLATIFIVVALGYAGSCDYQEEIISSISQELYDRIKKDLGTTVSKKDIVETYIANKEAYDNLGI
ncbi:MAG: hypothetical protein RR220_06665 [Bacteroidaceae bacterium]